MTHLQVIIGNTRGDRFASKVSEWVDDRLGERDDATHEMVDLRDYPLPFYDQPRSPSRTIRDYPDEATAALGRRLDTADAFIFLTPEYNHAYPAVLKNAIDHTFVEWNRKPAAFIGWGGAGGARAIEQLRLVTVELEMAPLRHAVHIMPDAMMAMRKDGADPVEVLAPFDGRLDRLATDLLWWSRALEVARSAG